MVRYRGKKALYEVMSKSNVKPCPGRTLEQLHPNQTPEVPPAVSQEPAVETPQQAVQWWKKPRMIRFGTGRIDFSISYQVAVALLLGLIFVILISYSLGHLAGRNVAQTAGNTGRTAANSSAGRVNPDAARASIPPEPAAGRLPENRGPAPAAPAGNNVIVLAQYKASADLVPVKEFFEKNGIPTEIVLEGSTYFLQTKNTYDNPDKSGTEGYKIKQRIITLGKGYKAPAGYETFLPKLFSDAYGRKVTR
jgi:hypothetical protein